MNITQRGVLPPVQFAELDPNVQDSLLVPAGTRQIIITDLTTAMQSSILGPENAAALVNAQAVRLLATLRHALLVYNGIAQTITRQVGITSVVRSSAGVYTVDYTAAGFTSAPYIAGNCRTAGTIFAWQSISNTQMVTNITDAAGVLTDEHLSLFVIGS